MLDPAEITSARLGLVQLRGSGGTGAYTYTLQEDASGASLNASTGAYVAGAASGVTDLVVLTDAGCDGEAEATIAVAPDLVVQPARVDVPPGTRVVPVISGGSGVAGCALAADVSGATLSGCVYDAGAGSGTDTLRVSDTLTGQSVDVQIEVSEMHTFQVDGYGHVYVPQGATFTPSATGGSGFLTVSVIEGDLVAAGDTLLASSLGSGTLRVSDTYADLSIDVPITIVAAIGPTLERDGELSGEGDALSLGDVDGDGYGDAALGFIEPSLDHYYSGVVALYRGGAAGLESEPVAELSGSTASETFGRAIASADLDEDGMPELLVGADKLDYGGTNNGAVLIYAGATSGFFETEPARSLYGQTEFERLGTAIAVGDLDGDGWRDLVVGAADGLDEAIAAPVDEQGAVHIFRGSAGGFEDKADFVLYGGIAGADAVWAGQEAAHFGTAVATGDLDGDGLLEVIVGGPDAGATTADGDGAVLIYQGTSDEGLVLTREPIGWIAGDAGSEGTLGERLAVGDIDGDGTDDLAVAEEGHDDTDADEGAVWVWVGLDLTELSAGTPLEAEDASWSVVGHYDGDHLGADLDLVDLDGDGASELVVGAARVDTELLVDVGAVYTFASSTMAVGGISYVPEDDASSVVIGVGAGARFGQAVAGLPGPQAGLLALAGADSTNGIGPGAPYFAWSTTGAVPTILSLAGEASGHAIGTSVLVLDVERDGVADLYIGAPDAGDPQEGANAGAVVVYPEGETGRAPVSVPAGHPAHSSGDRWGYGLAGGDFNGDGYDDLAVAGRRDSRPITFGSDYVNPDECAGYIAYAGSVHVYLGGPEGLATVPAFAWFTDTGSGYVYRLEGGFDHDGDGHDDLLVGSESWTDGGGFAIVYGRDEDPGGITVICEAEAWHSEEDFDRLGSSVADLGDLDGDGCDDLAVGASGEELGDDWYNQGVVRIFWGWGSDDCPSAPTLSTATLYIVGTELGISMDSGSDVDGDGLFDLVVGAAAYRAELSEVGAFFVVPGSHLLDLERVELELGVLPADELDHAGYLLPEDGVERRLGIHSDQAGSLFGAAVALVTDPEDPARSAVAVGIPQGTVGGTLLGGGVAIYRWRDDQPMPGLEEHPWGLVVGESFAPEGDLGEVLAGATLGGSPVLLASAPASSALGLEVGAVYVIVLDAG